MAEGSLATCWRIAGETTGRREPTSMLQFACSASMIQIAALDAHSKQPEEVVQVYGFCLTYITSSGDIRYDNRSYAVVVQRKSCARRQISYELPLRPIVKGEIDLPNT